MKRDILIATIGSAMAGSILKVPPPVLAVGATLFVLSYLATRYWSYLSSFSINVHFWIALLLQRVYAKHRKWLLGLLSHTRRDSFRELVKDVLKENDDIKQIKSSLKTIEKALAGQEKKLRT